MSSHNVRGPFQRGRFVTAFSKGLEASLALFFWFCSDRAPPCWVCIIAVTQQLQQRLRAVQAVPECVLPEFPSES